MLYIHPIFQAVGILIAFYVLGLGSTRFRMSHLKQKVRFKWKMHVYLGIATSCIWLVGICGGLYMVKTSWHTMLITGYHGNVGLIMIPFILFTLISGLYMHFKKKKRTLLPLLHASLNSVMLLLALSQAYTGSYVLQTYVLGI